MGNMFRYYAAAGYYFITQNTLNNKPVLLRPEIRSALKQAIIETQKTLPFDTHAFVLMPDHFHLILGIEDDKLSKRIGTIKRLTSKYSKFGQGADLTDNYRRERRSSLWQARFWEQTIKTEDELHKNIMYCYINPVHHGYVKKVGDWKFSTFHRDVRNGLLPAEWAGITVDRK
ncbi:REP-associated tyrosine transposase [Aliidiomarina quisquiliarum]|uniref:REP-associated tyrosine transposase n=1 Tax=Aliidiomarina quisquiliarum TaxID=2938947 RepID=UPI00208F61D2|nr:transposase [Aliidiomarina quisquiliarum]MCO4322451.1 transposase [Aliidiomarina quisquiliarum]